MLTSVGVLFQIVETVAVILVKLPNLLMLKEHVTPKDCR